MAVVCPAILAHTRETYRQQIEKVAHFAKRIQIDLTDGIFAGPLTVDSADAWWPAGLKADLHLMYDNPLSTIKELAEHKPNLVIVHAEARGDFNEVAKFCRSKKIKVGVALLAKTMPEKILSSLGDIDHVLIFSGDLGSYGGNAKLNLLGKVDTLKRHKPDLEIGWDGGVNAQNVSELVFGGVDVLNVGGFIQEADSPERAYHTLERIVEETGTT
jgi:ribulose-phosphate 3-epimerase